MLLANPSLLQAPADNLAAVFMASAVYQEVWILTLECEHAPTPLS